MKNADTSENMISRQQRIKIDAAGFYRQSVAQTLPSGLGSVRNELLQRYLDFYGLSDLVMRFGHRIGHYQLPIGPGYRIAVQQFGLGGEAGQVLIVHGYLVHTAQLRPVIRNLCEQGFEVLAFDLPGHGLSSGAPYEINDFGHYAEILAALVRCLSNTLQPDCTLIGHSTGCAIITDFLASTRFRDLQPESEALLLAPLLWPTYCRLIEVQYRLLHRLLKRVRRHYSPNSHDREFLARMKQDPLQYDFIPVAWVGAMLRWCREIEDYPQLSFKAHIIQGDRDTTVDWKRNLPELKRIFPQYDEVIIPGAMHELINEAEPWQSQTLQAIGQVLKSREAVV